MTDALIVDLGKIGALRVISRTSVMQYKEVRKPLPEIARELNVDAVVEGSVLRAGDQVRITAQLMRAAPEQQLWAQSYERDLSEILALQREVARAIAKEIKVALTPAEQMRLASSRPINSEAYQLYLKSRYYTTKGRWAPEGQGRQPLENAVEYAQQAIAKEPTRGLNYVALAHAYSILGTVEIQPRSEVFPKATAAALKALEFDDTLGEAHTTLGIVKMYEWDWKAAERELKRGVELSPGSSVAHDRYGIFLTMMGRHEEAIAEGKRAQELDPVSPFMNVRAGEWFYYARQYDEAIKQYQKALELDPNSSFAHWALGRAYVQKGMYEEAIAEFQKGVPPQIALPGYTYGVAGKRDEALNVLNTRLENWEQGRGHPAAIAYTYIGLGEKDKALEWLEKIYEMRGGWIDLIKVDPWYDSLRDDPRFQDLVRRMNFPE
jgi:tetratricopeptide (TPR) repeat protein